MDKQPMDKQTLGTEADGGEQVEDEHDFWDDEENEYVPVMELLALWLKEKEKKRIQEEEEKKRQELINKEEETEKKRQQQSRQRAERQEKRAKLKMEKRTD